MQAALAGSRSTVTANDIELNVRRRRTGRADGLEHLAAPNPDESEAALESKREIVTQLVHVHMLALQLFKCEQRHYDKQSAAGDQFYKSLTKKERDMAEELDDWREIYEDATGWQDDGTWARPGVFDVSVPMQSVDALAQNDLNSIILNSKPNSLYSYFLIAQKRLFEFSQTAMTDFGDQKVYERGSYRYDQTVIGIKNLVSLRLEANNNMRQLPYVLKTLQSLRNCVGRAAESLHLTGGELQVLKIKLSAFDQQSEYSKATRLVSYAMEYQPCLIDASSERWWDISDYTMGPRNSPTAPTKLASTTPHQESIRSTLTFVVPIVSLLSVIPAAVAWSHGDATPGSTGDSDFWQAISSSILQLLSLLTFIWPTLHNPRLSQLTWVWIWLLAGSSAICAIVSVSVYLVGSTTWSFSISFAGSLAQSFVQLQVVNAI